VPHLRELGERTIDTGERPGQRAGRLRPSLAMR
jgi:hypothetical protein